METGFAVAAFLALALNLLLPEEDEDEDIPELTADNADDQDDADEWDRIRAVDNVPSSTTKGTAS